jgi:torulene dioxygenase
MKDVLVSEPIFVPNTTLDNPAEDDGVILVTLLHENEPQKTTLLILNAKDMKELAQVEFKTEGTTPITFHGQWAQTGAKVHTY